MRKDKKIRPSVSILDLRGIETSKSTTYAMRLKIGEANMYIK